MTSVSRTQVGPLGPRRRPLRNSGPALPICWRIRPANTVESPTRTRPRRRFLKSGTKCYRIELGTSYESSNPGGFTALPGTKRFRTRPYGRLWLGPKRARSTPASAVKSSNSGSPDRGAENRKATGPSSYSVVAPGRSSCTGFPRASGRTSMTMSSDNSGKRRRSSCH